MERVTWSTLRERVPGLSPGSTERAPAPSWTLPPRPSTLDRAAPVLQEPASGPFGRYVVQRELAAGAMYRVFQAVDPLAKRLVAIKTLRWEHVTAETVAFCLARLDRQALTAGRLCHPHLVKVFDRGGTFLVLEYLEGLKLSTILRDRGQLDLGEALRLLVPLASALDHVHARSVVHRDVKPANVIVLADGSPKLIDFGAACLADRPLESWDRQLGTPSHMAPEQLLHGTANAATDLFSFGVLAYELLTGQPPFRGATVGSVTYRVVYDEPAPPSRWTPGLPHVHDEIFARMLAKDPERRLPSAGAFVRALQGGHQRRRTRTNPVAATPRGDERVREIRRLQESLPGKVSEACVVEVGSDPDGALVSWNGSERGVTPLSISEAGPGPHALRLMRDGYAPVEAAFILPEAPSLRLQFRLVAAPPVRVLDFRPRREP